MRKALFSFILSLVFTSLLLGQCGGTDCQMLTIPSTNIPNVTTGVASIYMPSPANSQCIHRGLSIGGPQGGPFLMVDVINGDDEESGIDFPLTVYDDDRRFCLNLDNTSSNYDYEILSGLVFAQMWNDKQTYGPQFNINMISFDNTNSSTIDIPELGHLEFGDASLIGNNTEVAMLSSELFWVINGGIKNVIGTANIDSYVLLETSYYLTKMWLNNNFPTTYVNPNLGNEYVGNQIVFNRGCNFNISESYKFASLLKTVSETFADPHKLEQIIFEAIKTRGEEMKNFDMSLEVFYQTVENIFLGIHPNSEITLTDNEFCTIQRQILSYFDDPDCNPSITIPAPDEKADLFIKINSDDDGTVPYIGAGDLLASPYLTVRRQDIKSHPEDVLHGIENHLQVQVGNRGPGICQGGILHLYWTKAQNQIIWPEDFESNTQTNQRITPNGGIPIGRLNPNSEKYIPFTWSDNIPDPTIIDSDSIIILARISDQHIGKHGQSFDNFGNIESFDEPNNLINNIANFNGIIANTFSLGKVDLNAQAPKEAAEGITMKLGKADPISSLEEKLILSTEIENEVYTIFPNPVSDILTIRCTDYTNTSVNLFNQTGQIVLSKNFHFSDQMNIDFTSFPSGIYTICVRNNSGNLRYEKIVKM